MRNPFRYGLAALGAVALGTGLILADVKAAAADDWPTRPITMVVGFGVGGSADRTARAVASFLPDEIGQPVVVVNRPGAGSQLAATHLLNQPHDGYTIFFSALSPFLATTIVVGGADYTLDDFAFVNAQWTDWDLVAVNKDTPYESLADLLVDIRDNPGKVRVSLVFGSSGHLNTLLLLDSLDIPHENLNLVNYDSGGAARTAVAGGHVEFTVLGGEGSEGVRDFIRPLAVIRDDPHPDWDAPPVNEALAPLDTEVPVVLGAMRGMATSAAFREQHPERFERLAEAYRALLEREDVQRYMHRGGIATEWLGPEETTRRIMQTFEAFKQYSEFLQN